MRKSIVSLFVVSLALTGCVPEWGPTFMPSGYTYHQEEYKAQPGPKAPDIGYEYSAGKNAEVLAAWNIIVSDLIDQMERDMGLGPQPVYVDQLPDTNAFNGAYDHSLREELRNRGYTLVTDPADHLHVRYEAFRSHEEKLRNRTYYNGEELVERKPYNPASNHDFIFAMTILRSGKAIGEVWTSNSIPAYGYEAPKSSLDRPDLLLSGPSFPSFEVNE